MEITLLYVFDVIHKLKEVYLFLWFCNSVYFYNVNFSSLVLSQGIVGFLVQLSNHKVKWFSRIRGDAGTGEQGWRQLPSPRSIEVTRRVAVECLVECL